MIVSVCYLFLFLFVGLLLARRAVPDADSAVLLSRRPSGLKDNLL